MSTLRIPSHDKKTEWRAPDGYDSELCRNLSKEADNQCTIALGWQCQIYDLEDESRQASKWVFNKIEVLHDTSCVYRRRIVNDPVYKPLRVVL